MCQVRNNEIDPNMLTDLPVSCSIACSIVSGGIVRNIAFMFDRGIHGDGENMCSEKAIAVRGRTKKRTDCTKQVSGTQIDKDDTSGA